MITPEENEELIQIATTQFKDESVWVGKLGFNWKNYAAYKKADTSKTFLQWSNHEEEI